MIAGTLWANLAIQAITFATSVLTARILGPIGRGELALVLLYPQLVAGVALMGVDRAVAILGGRGELARPVATVVKLALLLSGPAMAIGYITIGWRVTSEHLATLSSIYLAYVPAVYVFTLAVFLFNGIGDFARFNWVRLGFYVTNLVVLLIIWMVEPAGPLDWVVLANLSAVYGGVLLAAWFLRGLKQEVVVGAVVQSQGDVRAVLPVAVAFAVPVALANFSNTAYQILLEYWMGVGPLGLFVVFYSYSRLLSPVGNAVGSHLFHFSISGEQQKIARTFRQSLFVYLICAVPLWLVSGWLIPFVFGREFTVEGGGIALLFVSCLFGLLADNMAEFLKGRQRVGADTRGLVVYLATLGSISWSLVPSLGLIGMALAIATSDMLRCVYLVYQVSRETQQPVREFWLLGSQDILELANTGKRLFRGFRSWL